MYRTHVPIIAAGMRLRPSIMARGILFAVLSVRQPFYTTADQLAAVERDGEASPYLFSWKYDAFLYIRKNRDTLYHRLRTAPSTEAALWEITRVPGLGLVKGAFVLQLLGHDIACLDGNNMRAEGRNPRSYETRGGDLKATEAFRRMLARYIDDVGGKAESYWDSWCLSVGSKYGMTAEECSRLHLCIVPDAVRARLKPWTEKAPPLFDSVPF